MDIYTHTYTYTHIHTYTRTHFYALAHTHTHLHTHTHTHTNTHAHTSLLDTVRSRAGFSNKNSLTPNHLVMSCTSDNNKLLA
jgi:hypothetical protein